MGETLWTKIVRLSNTCKHKLKKLRFPKSRSLYQPHDVLSRLPIDLLHDILRRLRFDSVLKISCVSRYLHQITSDPSFISMQLAQPTTPYVVVVQHKSCREVKQVDRIAYETMLDFIYDADRKMTTTTTFSFDYMPEISQIPILYASYNGLLLFRGRGGNLFFIFNLVTQEKIVVSAPFDIVDEVCAFYFHTPTKEYKILYSVATPGEPYPHKILILGLKSKLLREICYSVEVPCSCRPPIVIDEALHWMTTVGPYTCTTRDTSPSCSNSILVFNMDNEQFSTMPHPGPKCDSIERHRAMQLLDIEGCLCLCVTLLDTCEICVWVMKDYRMKSWVKQHTVNFDSIAWTSSKLQSLVQSSHSSSSHFIQALHITKHKLVFIRSSEKIYSCDLQTNTLQSLEEVKLTSKIVNHTNSLASLKTSPSECIGRTMAERTFEVKPRVYLKLPKQHRHGGLNIRSK